MPLKDGTGPKGKGPKTGRGFGPCAPTSKPSLKPGSKPGSKLEVENLKLKDQIKKLKQQLKK